MLYRVVPCRHGCSRAEKRRVAGLQHATRPPRIVEADQRACRIDETGARGRNEGAVADRRNGTAAAGVIVRDAETPSATPARHHPERGAYHITIWTSNWPDALRVWDTGAWGLAFMRSSKSRLIRQLQRNCRLRQRSIVSSLDTTRLLKPA
jgi:hypothetical protein